MSDATPNVPRSVPELLALPTAALVDRREAARLLMTTPDTLAVRESRGLPSPPRVQLGRRVFYQVGDLLQWIEQHRTSPQSDPGR